MSYTDIEQELNNITDSLEQELRAAGAIGPDGKVINQDAFNKIIEEKITQCNVISMRMEASGKRFDANSANIIGARIDFLRTIQESQSLTPFARTEPKREEELIQQFENKKRTESFVLGSKLVNRLKGIFRRNPTQVNDRGK